MMVTDDSRLSTPQGRWKGSRSQPKPPVSVPVSRLVHIPDDKRRLNPQVLSYPFLQMATESLEILGSPQVVQGSVMGN